MLFVSRKSSWFSTDGRYAEQLKHELGGGVSIAVLQVGVSAAEEIAKIALKEKIHKIITDGSSPFGFVSALQKKLPAVRIEARNHLLHKLRAEKDRRELSLLRKAAEIAAAAYCDFLPFLRPGRTEREAAARLEELCREHGADELAFETIIASGVRGALPHARPTGKKLARSELVVVDFGVRAGGYVSDMTRTVALGRVPARLHRIYDAVKEAQARGAEAISPGQSGHEIDKMCRDVLDTAGLERYFVHATGHGIGLEVHELPILGPGSKDVLRPGMVVTCEPGVYMPNLGGVRIEDSLIVTKDGSENLSESVTKELIAL